MRISHKIVFKFITQESTMFFKPLSTIFTNSCVKIFSSTINQNLFTKSNIIRLSSKSSAEKGEKTTLPTDPSPPRTITRQEPGPVRLGFIPDEWFTFFFPKTGVSGAGTFAFTVSTFLMSKEYYVMEHEYYGGLSMLILCALSTKYIGPAIAEYLDTQVDAYEKGWTDSRTDSQNLLEKAIKHEEHSQWSYDGQLMLIEAKRENVALQLEAAYRKRLMRAYVVTRKHLQYCVDRNEVERAIVRRHMASWVVKEVSKSLSDKIEKESINKCLNDLEKLAENYKGLLATDYPAVEDDSYDSPPTPSKPKKK